MNAYGFFRAAGAVPLVKTAGVEENCAGIIELYKKAVEDGADLVVFPELSLTAYTCGDLFSQSKLLSLAEEAAVRLAEVTGERGSGRTRSGDLPPVIFGLPLRVGGVLYNCAAFAWNGRLLGIVPKTYLPNTHEFYEQRWFGSAHGLLNRQDLSTVEIDGVAVPFGADLLFNNKADNRIVIGIEICEDLWAPLPPSSRMALGGATIIANPSASNELAGKSAYRRELVLQQSGRGLAGYIYVSSGVGESSTDTVYGGETIIAENGRRLAMGERFLREPEIVMADIDMEFLSHERITSNSFSQAAAAEAGREQLRYRLIEWGCIDPVYAVSSPAPSSEINLMRWVDPRPFVPSGLERRKERCEEIFSIQSQGLASRLAHIGCKDVVIGLSGGLDSTLALLVSLKAFEILGLDRHGIHSYTMPGFGTTGRTLGNVKELCRLMDLPLESVDIRKSCEVQMADLDHSGEPSDVAYENVQARYRTALLMNKSNMVRGIVIGTGDLSELALGWCTYNGDHMSMYAVNTGVPKTLVTYLVEYAADTRPEEGVGAVLRDIIGTPISPELLPPDKAGAIAQKTEEVVGPYELHDFFLYQGIRCGFSPSKVFFLAKQAFCERSLDFRDSLVSGIEEGARSEEEILKWLEVFYRRFFSQQFKRSCLPDGPKVGTIALSPRGDWRMPSDASAKDWLDEINTLKENL
ncbi:MAG: NAD(+) synthase [Spirochaetales bacterium]|nr:NAD(+) synthase [Spirochaetales bacterium]